MTVADMDIKSLRVQAQQALVNYVEHFDQELRTAATLSIDRMPSSGQQSTIQVLDGLRQRMQYMIPGVRIDNYSDRLVPLADYARVLVDRLQDDQVQTLVNDLNDWNDRLGKSIADIDTPTRPNIV